MRVFRTTAGIEEDITLALGYGGNETPPLRAVESLAAQLDAEHGLVTLLTALRAQLEPPPIPVTFTLGHDEARRLGPARAEQTPLGLTPTRLGPPAEPALHTFWGWNRTVRLVHLPAPHPTPQAAGITARARRARHGVHQAMLGIARLHNLVLTG